MVTGEVLDAGTRGDGVVLGGGLSIRRAWSWSFCSGEDLTSLVFHESKRGQGGRERKVVKQGGSGRPAGLTCSAHGRAPTRARARGCGLEVARGEESLDQMDGWLRQLGGSENDEGRWSAAMECIGRDPEGK